MWSRDSATSSSRGGENDNDVHVKWKQKGGEGRLDTSGAGNRVRVGAIDGMQKRDRKKKGGEGMTVGVQAPQSAIGHRAIEEANEEART